ncbi:Imm32 family immunity protein [Dyella flava]|uniref:Imm32 family immunity protein n=1 Tax=Dyella flava TaxID=1920170 RepID=UPI00235CD6DD|nr:hypothetical protein GCM10010872_07940 [Dyella flava]
MKLYGYRECSLGQHGPDLLIEVTVQASPEEIRAIAKLLADIANEMERSDFDHVHLNDRISMLESSPRFIVARTS